MAVGRSRKVWTNENNPQGERDKNVCIRNELVCGE